MGTNPAVEALGRTNQGVDAQADERSNHRPNQRARSRQVAVAEAVDQIRRIESDYGVTRPALEQIKQVLLSLAAQHDLFPVSDFPAIAPPGRRANALYRLNEDEDHRFALYAQLCQGGTTTPAHDHTTWAVIVGIEGQELNKLYERTIDGSVHETGSHVVEQGSGVAFMPDDLHSIHIEPDSLVLNFHMYGLALEQLHGRRFFKESSREWLHFPASSGIRELPVPA
ncbi:MAG: cysteine dioxygenase [Burkholderiaceae bacterium]